MRWVLVDAMRPLAAVVAPLVGVVLLAAGRPGATGSRPSIGQQVTGIRYDIDYSTTNATSEGSSANSAAAHVQIANRRIRLDVASGEFGGLMSSGDFMILTDSSHTATIFKPSTKQYFQIDLATLTTKLTGVVNAFGGALGVQATNVKLDLASLGAGDLVGPFTTQKYRLTQDYLLTVAVMGMSQSSPMHSTTDYWFAPQLTMIVNPFAHTVQESAWLGAAYGTQLAAVEAKLPKTIPVKQVMTDIATDANGAKTTTTVTWQLSGFVRANIADVVFEAPTDYAQLQGPSSLLQSLTGLTGGGNPFLGGGTSTNGVTGSTSTGSTWNGSTQGGSTNTGASTSVQPSGGDAAASTIKKILHIP